MRFVRNEYTELEEPTIGAAFLTQSIELDNRKVKFEIWDTAGQERYKTLAPMYYRGADVALIVFDLTKKETFVGAQQWINELKKKGERKLKIAVAANKCDDIENRQVSSEEVLEFVKKNNVLYQETSAKLSTNVRELFVELAEKLPVKSKKRKKLKFEEEESELSCC